LKLHQSIFFFILICVASYFIDGLLHKGLLSFGMDATRGVYNATMVDLSDLLAGHLFWVIPAFFVGWTFSIKPLKAAGLFGVPFVALFTLSAVYSSNPASYHHHEWIVLTPVRALFALTAFIVVACAAAVLRRDYLPPNNSFKPKPLRGSA
jgi:hypothetical protein